MDFLIEALESYGYLGMTIAAFLAGSVFPFSSEAVMVSLQLAGLEPWPLFLSATVGNVVGSMFNYWIGTFGRMEWIEKYLHISAEKVNKTRAWIDGRGAWIGTLCFLPILGSVLSVTLGYMRANPYTTFMSISVGKAMRYAIIIISIYYINN
ncbi:MAG: VTT domain-containing protein [Bacteroidaceae bacterium]|jgi:membrane protein YqaA with SNARE-associated domain|nr:VTT domain-containing protein [Bacteroidaceae bacterium]